MRSRWDLTAPESLVVRDGPYWAKPAEVIKVAVLEPVTRRVLRLVEVESRDRRGRRTTEMVLGAGGRPVPVEGPLAPGARIALEASATNYPDGTVGAGIPSFANTFVAKHGNNQHKYIQQSVRPALVGPRARTEAARTDPTARAPSPSARESYGRRHRPPEPH